MTSACGGNDESPSSSATSPGRKLTGARQRRFRAFSPRHRGPQRPRAPSAAPSHMASPGLQPGCRMSARRSRHRRRATRTLGRHPPPEFHEPSSCESSFNKGSEKGRLARSLSFGGDAARRSRRTTRRRSRYACAARPTPRTPSARGMAPSRCLARLKVPVDRRCDLGFLYRARRLPEAGQARVADLLRPPPRERPRVRRRRMRHAHQDAPAPVPCARAASRHPSGPRRHGGGRGRREAAAAFDDFDQVWAGLPPSTNVSPNLIACFDDDDYVQERPFRSWSRDSEDLCAYSLGTDYSSRSTSVDAAASTWHSRASRAGWPRGRPRRRQAARRRLCLATGRTLPWRRTNI